MKASISDFEVSLHMPSRRRNEVTVEDGDTTAVYVGKMWGLHFDYVLNIEGGATLTRYDRRTLAKARFGINLGILDGSLSPRLERRQVPITYDRKLWRVHSGEHDTRFVSWGGKICEEGASYRDALKGAAANQGIIVTNRLLDTVFGPLDAELLEIYRRVAQHVTRGDVIALRRTA